MSRSAKSMSIPCGWQQLKIQEITAPGDWEWEAASQQWVPVLVRQWVCYGETRIRRMSFRVGEAVRVIRENHRYPELHLCRLIVAKIFSTDAQGKQLLYCDHSSNFQVRIESDFLQPACDNDRGGSYRPLERWNLQDVITAEMHPQDNPNFVQNPTSQQEPTVEESSTVESNNPEIPDSSNFSETPNSSVDDYSAELNKMVMDRPTETQQMPHVHDTDFANMPNEMCGASEPIKRKRVLYIAGPMRGIAWFNFPLFDRVAKDLRDAGNEVISPADEDRKEDGFDPFANPRFQIADACVFPHEMDFAKTVRRCLEAVLRCDEIILLPGWENSNGAVAELALAMWLGKQVRHLNIADDNRLTFARRSTSLMGLAAQLTEHHMPKVRRMGLAEQDDEDDRDILAEASRITRGSRQLQYGPPDQDFRRTAGMWSALFESKLKYGMKFEPRDVALAMILLKTSRETHQRKRDNWVDIAGYASCGSRCH
jgi:hypothetical protein